MRQLSYRFLFFKFVILSRLENNLITGRICNWKDEPEFGEDECLITCENADIKAMQQNARDIWNEVNNLFSITLI